MKRMQLPAVAQLFHHLLEALFELAAVLGAGHHGGHVERYDALVFQRFEYVAGDDAVRQSLDDGGLAHAGLADEGRVVLGAARQYLYDALDFLVAADDRVQPAGARFGRQVARHLVQGGRLAGGLGGAALVGILAEEARDLGARLLQRDAEAVQHAGGHAVGFAQQAEQQVLGADVVMAHLAGFVDGQLNDALGAGGQPGTGGGDLFAGADDVFHRGAHLGQADAHVYEHAGGHAFLLLNQAQQDVLGAYVVVVEALGFFLSQAEDAAGSFREFIKSAGHIFTSQGAAIAIADTTYYTSTPLRRQSLNLIKSPMD